MKVFGKCQNCKNEISVSVNYGTRLEIAMYEGETKSNYCKNCNKKNEFHINDLRAKESKFSLIISGLIFLIGTPLTIYLLFDYLIIPHNPYIALIIAGFIAVPMTIYGIIRKQDMIRVRAFNRAYK
ncbi:hypothetical protein SAMN05444411_1214 [Lutibacter oricola]|uniref:Cxxc_20_cxxc protein n=1 Tax=Lutibacter oricola TaxID=762486 RepID=A0A1H3GYY0_9FLAO|nr:hypothetical protein [Lutibacter oricola]SDY08451.1 hypothetical protein SAMN05444411_1214 [Lutibacter oricola]